jgi:hypothetical protein
VPSLTVSFGGDAFAVMLHPVRPTIIKHIKGGGNIWPLAVGTVSFNFFDLKNGKEIRYPTPDRSSPIIPFD